LVIPVSGLFMVSPAAHTPCFRAQSLCWPPMFACHRAIRNVGGRSETQCDCDPATLPERSDKTPAKSCRSKIFDYSDRAFDMAADRLFHSHPV
jgi:hypothetical protein